MPLTQKLNPTGVAISLSNDGSFILQLSKKDGTEIGINLNDEYMSSQETIRFALDWAAEQLEIGGK